MKLSEKDLREKHGERQQELEKQLKDTQVLIDSYRKEHGRLELFFDRIAAAIHPLTPAKIQYKPQKTDSPVVAVMQISDSHMGAVQVSSEIEGLNEFNPEICVARNLDYVKRFLEWVTMHRQAYTINEVAVIVTGDLISGDIHEELKVTNAFPTPVQCVRAAEILTQQVALLAGEFQAVTVHFLVEDNHARLTKKPQAKEAGYNSLNYVVGKIAQIYLERHGNVDFQIYPAYQKVIHVSNRNYLISHGHGIQGWMGRPWYGIERFVSKESQKRLAAIMDDKAMAKQIGFHKFVFGHFHTPFEDTMYSCCGSVQGTDAYDHKNGRYSPPSQSSWMVHPKHGEFNRINFNL